jgi:hypothetical protein
LILISRESPSRNLVTAFLKPSVTLKFVPKQPTEILKSIPKASHDILHRRQSTNERKGKLRNENSETALELVNVFKASTSRNLGQFRAV